MFDPLGDDVVDMIVVQGIVDRLSFAAVLHQLGILQDAQLMGDGGLIHLQEFRDLRDASFIVDQAVKDPDPGRIGEILEQFRGIVQRILFYFFHQRSFTPKALIALMTAMTMTPTSEKTAMRICARPKALNMSVRTLTAMAKMMFS